ncbi:unnamed protein product [Cuscuta epithymum]|uniref:Thylakoid soluble phosphoprotein TSP9 n=1 Tax=Cuscuta epithymum TaxID=186058 RepID=A0AAV0CH44_9ASTE|nr:unnamed protein product [Cuscuta epithymum]CAH9121013.1 unnamed protein product [Cuscuta epithymum]
MASLHLSFTPVTALHRRSRTTAAASKSSGGSSREKGLLDWILSGMQKEDQLFETDPILDKVEEEKRGGTVRGRRNSVAVPQPKGKSNGGDGGGFGGFAGLFAKKRK